MTTFEARISARPVIGPRLSPRDFATAAAQRVGMFIDRLLDWQERARQRRQLLALGDRALLDFGASRADAVVEGDKPFWRG